MKDVLRTQLAAPPGGPYSQIVKAGEYVYLAGTGPTRPDGEPVRGSFEQQARQAFDNLRHMAEAAGTSLADAVRVGVYLRDMSHFEQMNGLFREYFGDQPPVRTTLPVALDGFDIEIDAILYTGN